MYVYMCFMFFNIIYEYIYIYIYILFSVSYFFWRSVSPGRSLEYTTAFDRRRMCHRYRVIVMASSLSRHHLHAKTRIIKQHKSVFSAEKHEKGKHTKTLYKSQTTYCIRTTTIILDLQKTDSCKSSLVSTNTG